MFVSRVLPQQAEVLRCKDQLAAVRGGIRSGKSRMFADWVHDRMEQYPKAQHFVVGADLPQLKRGFLRTFTTLLTGYGVKFDYSKTDGTVTLKSNGGKLECLSAEIEDRIRGSEFDTVLLEEPQTWKSGNGLEIYETVIGRMSGSAAAHLHHPGLEPQLRMSFNPSAVGTWLWSLLEEKRVMKCWQFSVRKNTLMPGYKKFIALQESQLPEHLWPVELDGEWGTTAGVVYRYYNKDWHAQPKDGLPPLIYDPTKPIEMMHDFNVDPMTLVVGQTHVQDYIQVGYEPPDPYLDTQVAVPIIRPRVEGYQRTLLYLLDEFRLPNSGALEIAMAFVNSEWGERARHTGVVLYGDPAGGNRSQLSTGGAIKSAWGTVIDVLQRNGIQWEWRVKSRSSQEYDRVNHTNLTMKDPDGIGMIVDHQKCPWLIKDFQTVKWVDGQNKIDKTDPKITHESDAVGYRCDVERLLLQGESIDWKELPDLLTR